MRKIEIFIEKLKLTEYKYSFFNCFITKFSAANNPSVAGNLNYFNFISDRLIHHYSKHGNEQPPMISVSEFKKTLNRNHLCIKIVVQIDDYIEHEYPPYCHTHFDNDSIKITNCRISPKNYLLIIEGETETGQEVKLFWGEKHFEILKNTAPCTETITKFEKLKQQNNTDKCVSITKLHTVFLVVCKKYAVTLSDNKLKNKISNDTYNRYGYISII